MIQSVTCFSAPAAGFCPAIITCLAVLELHAKHRNAHNHAVSSEVEQIPLEASQTTDIVGHGYITPDAPIMCMKLSVLCGGLVINKVYTRGMSNQQNKIRGV